MATPTQWDGQSKGSVLGTRIFLKLISVVGLYPAYCLLAPVSLYYVFREKESCRVIGYFRSRLGLPTNIFHLWRHFFSFGMSILDRYAFLSKSGSFFTMQIINEEAISQALSAGKGVILVGAHIGNWEIAGNLLQDRIQVPINYTMVDAEKPEISKAFGKAFDRRRATIIPINQDSMGLMLEILKALRGNEIVCMHGDRLFGGTGRTTQFLNRPVEFPIGPFAIAAATGAPVIPIFAVKKGLRTYEMKAFDPIEVTTTSERDKESCIGSALEQFVGILEQVSREHPYEWFNFYDFWGEAK
jgi:predicted LPLAT superfamily acyltransferase